jgi:hypothetical protein
MMGYGRTSPSNMVSREAVKAFNFKEWCKETIDAVTPHVWAACLLCIINHPRVRHEDVVTRRTASAGNLIHSISSWL